MTRPGASINFRLHRCWFLLAQRAELGVLSNPARFGPTWEFRYTVVRLKDARKEVRRRLSLRVCQGTKKFGWPAPAHEPAMSAMTDFAQLEALGEKLVDESTWDQLLTNG